MFVNSSSSVDVLTIALSPFNSSTVPFYLLCQDSVPRKVIYTAYAIANVLLLFPLYILVLCTGFVRWRRQRSAAGGTTMMSHSDFFTYNMMLPEISCVLGCIFHILGIYARSQLMFLFSVFLFCVILPGQTLFHVLTCAERYLAVIYPVAYMRLRETSGIRVRNVATACVWLLCFAWAGVVKLYMPRFPTAPFFSVLGICIFVMLFFCFSVLRALTRPALGDGGGNKRWADQSKRRAFNLIVAITVTLLLRFVGLLLCFILENVVPLDTEYICTLLDSGIWLTVPSSLVLPLLFLHRNGKLPCCRSSSESK